MTAKMRGIEGEKQRQSPLRRLIHEEGGDQCRGRERETHTHTHRERDRVIAYIQFLCGRPN